MHILELEKPIFKLKKEIEEYEEMSQQNTEIDYSKKIESLSKELEKTKENVYNSLDAWDKTQIARHQNRFSILDFLEICVEDFLELHGDRQFSDDASIVCGMGKLMKIPFVFIGHQKGRDTKENIYRNFGMPKPEGYRKALRVMKLAEKFSLPIVTFIDTPGAFPGIEAEERNQSEAIARNLIEMGGIKTPSISIVLGEGGSGGALALAVTDVVMMMEHSIYSVISPEGCSSILWKTPDRAEEASKNLCYTAQKLLELGVVQKIIPEPLGGTHLNHKMSAKNIEVAILEQYKKLKEKSTKELLEQRYKTFYQIGLDYIQNL